MYYDLHILVNFHNGHAFTSSNGTVYVASLMTMFTSGSEYAPTLVLFDSELNRISDVNIQNLQYIGSVGIIDNDSEDNLLFGFSGNSLAHLVKTSLTFSTLHWAVSFDSNEGTYQVHSYDKFEDTVYI